MSYYRGGNPLPFDPERVDGRNMVNNRPDLGRLDLGEMNPFIGDLIDALIIQIQDNAETNPLRTFAFNLWSDGRFRNRQFAELVQAFAAHVEGILITQPQADPIKVIEGEAGFFAESATAFLVEQFPAITEYLPQEAEPTIQGSIQNWHGIVRDIRAIQRQSGVGRASYGGGNGNRPAYGGGGGSGFGRPANVGMGSAFRTGTGSGGGAYQGRFSNKGPAVDDLRPSWELNKDSQRVEEVASRSGFNSIVKQTQAPTQDAPIRRVDLSQKVEAAPARVYTAKGTVSTDPAHPFDHVVLADGRIVVPAFKSTWTPLKDIEHLPLVFERESKMLFHVKLPSGEVVESIQTKVPEMDYLEHELDEKLKQIYRTNQKVFDPARVVPQMKLVRTLTPTLDGKVATHVDEEQRQKLSKMGAPKELIKPFQAASLQEAEHLAKLEAWRLEEDGDLLEYQVEEIGQWPPKEQALQGVLQVGRTTDYKACKEALTSLHQEGKLSDEVLEILNQRLTDTFNRVIKKQLFLTQWIDSFIADIEDIDALVKSRYGEKIYQLFQATAKEVIGRGTAILTGEALSHYLKSMSDVDLPIPDQPAVFCERYSVTDLPWTMVDMALSWRLEGIVTPENAKPFHEALSAVFGRTQRYGAHEHLLVTKDKKVLYAYRSALGDGNFTITQEPANYMDDFLKNIAI